MFFKLKNTGLIVILLRKLLNMKTEIKYYFKKLITKSSLIKAGWRLMKRLMKKGSYFILFPYYWEMIPLRLEKAMADKKIEVMRDRKGRI